LQFLKLFLDLNMLNENKNKMKNTKDKLFMAFVIVTSLLISFITILAIIKH